MERRKDEYLPIEEMDLQMRGEDIRLQFSNGIIKGWKKILQHSTFLVLPIYRNRYCFEFLEPRLIINSDFPKIHLLVSLNLLVVFAHFKYKIRKSKLSPVEMLFIPLLILQATFFWWMAWNHSSQWIIIPFYQILNSIHSIHFPKIS